MYVINRIWRLFVCLIVLLSSCMDDDVLWTTNRQPAPELSKGVFVVNEGNFMYGNASLSYYDLKEEKVYNEVFFNTNGLPLGDVAISMVVRDSLGYVVVNNSSRIYVMNIHTFGYVGKITGLTSPRFMHFVSDTKAYVTDLYARAITIVDPVSMEITGSIPLVNEGSRFYQHATEQMVQHGQYVFVNCWSFDSNILVIDTETDEWVNTIEVLKQPESMALDRHGKLWVLSDGGFPGSPFGQEAPGLMRIDLATGSMEHTYRFDMNDSPRSLTINGNRDTLYFVNRHVYRHAVIGSAEPEIFIANPYTQLYAAGFHGVGVDPGSSEVFVTDAIDFMQPGLVYRFQADATPVDTFRVGIIPRTLNFISQ